MVPLSKRSPDGAERNRGSPWSPPSRGTLKTFGLVLGKVAAGAFEARVRQLIAGNPLLVEVIEALLKVWRTTGEQLVTLHRRVLRLTHPTPSWGGRCSNPGENSGPDSDIRGRPGKLAQPPAIREQSHRSLLLSCCACAAAYERPPARTATASIRRPRSRADNIRGSFRWRRRCAG